MAKELIIMTVNMVSCVDAVLGVSNNDVDSHIKFTSELDLPFPLLADEV